ncbi:hypothetical protein PVL29_008127 [Vitis rotundifolia]|uniref:Uncharacterized protein n=1 Tax=Vitis rotundifolia TaxID=103349 RepID=A0AA39A1U2_VITRO|nr:hypothetical protein PVL29_008127 [Vitis rotundifolia]
MITLIGIISRNSLRWHGMSTSMYLSSSSLGDIKGQMQALTNPLQLFPLLMVLLKWHRILIVKKNSEKLLRSSTRIKMALFLLPRFYMR